jgi:hypothetical protein
MPNYYCASCQNAFDKLGGYAESRPIGTESFNCCPHCKSQDYVEYSEFEDDVKEDVESFLNGKSNTYIDTVYKLFQEELI